MSGLLIKRFEDDLPLPEYKTAGAAGFDLYSRISVTIEPGEMATIPLNVAIQIPEGHWIMFAARSSLHKKGLLMPNSLAVMDADFCGDNDEYRVVLHNFSKETAHIERGERLVQAVVMQLFQFPIAAVDHLGNPDRGGFGSTGRH